jgi:hypothetical protein
MLNGTNLLIAGIVSIAAGVALVIWGNSDTANVMAGVLITAGVSLWGAKPLANAVHKNGK